MDLQNFQFDQRMLTSMLLVVLAYFIGRRIPRWISGVPYVKPEQARAQLEANPHVLVVDVRAPSQFSGGDGHIQNALNLPLIDLMGRIRHIKQDLAQYAETPVLVVCKSDQLSARAARILRKNGLNKVSVLDGGLKAWKKAGLPVVNAA